MVNIEGCKQGVYIYGTGKYGSICREYLKHVGLEIKGLIISDDQQRHSEYIDGYKVFYLSEVVDLLAKGTIILALSKNNCTLVKKTIGVTSLLDACRLKEFSEEEYFEMYRTTHPVDASKIFKQSGPLDDSNGGARGTTISRYYISKFLDYAYKKINSQEHMTTYEVGDLRYSEEYYPNARHLLLDYTQKQDLTKIETLPKSDVDVFICTQVYNFLFDVPAAIEGSKYVLKEGGALLCTVVGNVSQVIRGDMDDYGDYWRFTYLGIRRLMEQFFDNDKIEVISYGNAMATTAYLQGLCVEDLPDEKLLDELDPDYALVIGILARK